MYDSVSPAKIDKKQQSMDECLWALGSICDSCDGLMRSVMKPNVPEKLKAKIEALKPLLAELRDAADDSKQEYLYGKSDMSEEKGEPKMTLNKRVAIVASKAK